MKLSIKTNCVDNFAVYYYFVSSAFMKTVVKNITLPN